MQRTKNILAYQHITVTGKNNACSLKDFSLSSGISEIVSIFGKKEDGLENLLLATLGLLNVNSGKINLNKMNLTNVKLREMLNAGVVYVLPKKIFGQLRMHPRVFFNIQRKKQNSRAWDFFPIVFSEQWRRVKKELCNEYVLLRDHNVAPKLMIAYNPFAYLLPLNRLAFKTAIKKLAELDCGVLLMGNELSLCEIGDFIGFVQQGEIISLVENNSANHQQILSMAESAVSIDD